MAEQSFGIDGLLRINVHGIWLIHAGLITSGFNRTGDWRIACERPDPEPSTRGGAKQRAKETFAPYSRHLATSARGAVSAGWAGRGHRLMHEQPFSQLDLRTRPDVLRQLGSAKTPTRAEGRRGRERLFSINKTRNLTGSFCTPRGPIEMVIIQNGFVLQKNRISRGWFAEIRSSQDFNLLNVHPNREINREFRQFLPLQRVFRSQIRLRNSTSCHNIACTVKQGVPCEQNRELKLPSRDSGANEQGIRSQRPILLRR